MSNLKKIIRNFKQATFLFEKKLLTKFSFRETIELRIHLYGYSFCKFYKKQSRLINDMVQELFRSPFQPNLQLKDDFKKEVQERIEAELNKN